MSREEIFNTGKKVIINGYEWTIVPIPKKTTKRSKKEKLI